MSQLHFKEWYFEWGAYELDAATEPGGCYDCMAEVRSIGPNQWRIRWWAAPQSPSTGQSREFEGTLEEAKALATALVKM